MQRQLAVAEAEELAARRIPRLTLSAAEVADLRALATGAYSPLGGFMDAEQHQGCVEDMRLPDGTLWPIPVCLGLPDGAGLGDGGLVALRGQDGALLGVLEVQEVFE
ncbi:MAG TPA: sulfate adenylyltransferase, partial [Actinomycetota bacterium]|nr:sulfate adenylyltransferase [Actinomycetota bacterium]